ncbi:hypothetical protein [Methylobacterium aquaticum]|uniref:hypothetical protein n=1 Tax=Methylobacterium aquaticum TaxID=270351 RepID=UPI0019324DA8|nr:hypothetical protein [Methylobacterium aquaticum]QRE77339.1 hypothetical protein F1D61_30850 [Methylobacterium aquaticum]
MRTPRLLIAALLALAPSLALAQGAPAPIRLPKGSTGPADDLTLAPTDSGALRRSLAAVFRDLPVYPQSFGAVCNGGAGGSNDTAAYQAAANVAVLFGRALHLGGAGLCITTAPVTLSKPIPLRGDGEAVCTLVGLHNGPILQIAANAAAPSQVEVSGCTFRHQSAAPAAYNATRAIKITGGNYVSYARFSNLTTQGFYAAFEVATGTQTTDYGQENLTAWTSWDRITILSGARGAHYGWYYPAGSGTGNTYTNIKTGLSDADSAIFRYEGTGAVVGDILINQCHCAGNTNAVGASLISIGPGTVYRSSISVVNSQMDSGMGAVFDFSPDGVPYFGVRLIGTNIANGIVVNKNNAQMIASTVTGVLANDLRDGIFKQVSAAPNLAVPVFRISVGKAMDGLNFASLYCEVVATGVIPNVGPSVTRATLALFNSNGTVSATVGTPERLPSTGFDVSASASGSVVTVNTVFPSGSGSSGTSFDAQARCTGGAAASLSPL